MFELNEDTSMLKHCSFCNEEIKGMPASSLDKSLLFCDIVCAKLYYDTIHRFKFNKREYNNFYINDQLTNRASEIYSHLGGIMFELLPYTHIDGNINDINVRRSIKAKYIKGLTPIMFNG